MNHGKPNTIQQLIPRTCSASTNELTDGNQSEPLRDTELNIDPIFFGFNEENAEVSDRLIQNKQAQYEPILPFKIEKTLRYQKRSCTKGGSLRKIVVNRAPPNKIDIPNVQVMKKT